MVGVAPTRTVQAPIRVAGAHDGAMEGSLFCLCGQAGLTEQDAEEPINSPREGENAGYVGVTEIQVDALGMTMSSLPPHGS